MKHARPIDCFVVRAAMPIKDSSRTRSKTLDPRHRPEDTMSPKGNEPSKEESPWPFWVESPDLWHSVVSERFFALDGPEEEAAHVEKQRRRQRCPRPQQAPSRRRLHETCHTPVCWGETNLDRFPPTITPWVFFVAPTGANTGALTRSHPKTLKNMSLEKRFAASNRSTRGASHSPRRRTTGDACFVAR